MERAAIKRSLDVDINVRPDGSAEVSFMDPESSDSAEYKVAASDNCNDADGLTKELGYEILSWVSMAREELDA